MIRPLEKERMNKWLVLKIVFLLMIIILAVYANFFVFERKKENEKILGEKTIQSVKKNPDSFSLEEAGQTAKNLFNQTTKQAQKEANNILGEMTDIISETASKSAKTVSDFIFDSTVGNIIKQIEKLPKEEKEKIREYILNIK